MSGKARTDDVGQILELLQRIERVALPLVRNLDPRIRQAWIGAPMDDMAALLAQSMRDLTVVNVDRTFLPSPPNWLTADCLVPVEVAESGPATYDLDAVTHFYLREQHQGLQVPASQVYAALKRENLLRRTFSLADYEALRRKPASVFRAYFSDRSVYLWKCAAVGYDGVFYVPYMWGVDGHVDLRWATENDLLGPKSVTPLLPWED